VTEPNLYDVDATTPSSKNREKNSFALAALRGLVGAVVGGAIGWYGFHWLVGQGLLAPMLPGALVGLGCGMSSGWRSQTLGMLCGAGGLIIGLLAYWQVLILKDDSLSFFISHLHERSPQNLLMFGLGGLLAYWFGLGRKRF